MNTYICDSHRPAQAKSLKDAAEIFAFRKAKIEFGKRAKVPRVELNKWNGEIGEFKAIIGRTFKKGFIGNPILFSVYRVGYEEEK